MALRERCVEITGFPETDNPGAVYLMHDPLVDMLHETLDPMLDWLELELTRDHYDGEFDKLARSGCAEQHLFLRVHTSGMPYEYDHLSTTMQVPSRPLAIDGRHLTVLWLAPDFSPSVLWWMADRGWYRFVRASDTPPSDTTA